MRSCAKSSCVHMFLKRSPAHVVIIFLFSSFSSSSLHVFHVQYLPSSLLCSIAIYVLFHHVSSSSCVSSHVSLWFYVHNSISGCYVLLRETREGPADWKLKQLGSQRVHLNRVLTWLVRWSCRAGTRDFCPALAAPVGPVQNISFLAVHNFNSFVLIAKQAGQAAVLGRLSLSMCL